jgi:DNA ligase-associated metallophosphoesterase
MRPCGLSERSRISLAGLDLIPDLSGALYVRDFETLLVADLHLEKASNIARRGLHLPPYDTRASLGQLTRALAASGAKRVIFLGDSFHDDEAASRIDRTDLAALQAITERIDTIWITGNHDPNPPAEAGGRIVSEVNLGPLLLRHEPRLVADGSFEIAGHLHPAASVSQRGRRIRCKCFIGNERQLIMPAFGSFTGSLNVSAEPFRQIFGSREFSVWMLGARQVYKLPGRRVS